MEDIIERISSGENLTIILGYSSPSNVNTTSNTNHCHQQYLSLLLQMKRLYCNLHIILFHYGNNHPINLSQSHSSSNSNSFSSSGECQNLFITTFFTDPTLSPSSGETSSLTEKENQLKSSHRFLLKSSLLFLIDMNLQSITSTSASQDTRMEYSQFSQILLYHLRRENLNTYCLHSSVNVFKEKPSSPNISVQQSITHSPHPFLQFSRQYLNETRMIHLVQIFPLVFSDPFKF